MESHDISCSKGLSGGSGDDRVRKTDDQSEEYGILEIKIFGGDIVMWYEIL